MSTGTDDELLREFSSQRLRFIIAIGVILALAAAGVCLVWLVWKAIRAQEPKLETYTRQMRVPPPQGNPHAKVAIDLLIPTQARCQLKTAEFLMFIARRYPDILYVRFSDMLDQSSQTGRFAISEPCSYVFINGKNQFRLANGKGKLREVCFSGPVDGDYTLDDLLAAIRQELVAEKVPIPPGFDRTVEEFKKADKSQFEAELLVPGADEGRAAKRPLKPRHARRDRRRARVRQDRATEQTGRP